jgi:PEP-CTERM motif
MQSTKENSLMIRPLLFVASASVLALSASPALSASFTLVGSELRLRTEAQSTPTSQLFVTSFPVAAPVSEAAVEFPTVASLFDPSTGVPPGFARSLVNVAIDAGANYLAIDFDNVGSSTRYASGFQNTYVFSFTAPISLQISDVAIDPSTNLGLTRDRVTFAGNELFVNVQGLSFNPNSFARINLDGVIGSDPGSDTGSDTSAAVPEPSTMLLAGGAALLGGVFKRRRDRPPVK